MKHKGYAALEAAETMLREAGRPPYYDDIHEAACAALQDAADVLGDAKANLRADHPEVVR
jgi:hypothetical protein